MNVSKPKYNELVKYFDATNDDINRVEFVFHPILNAGIGSSYEDRDSYYLRDCRSAGVKPLSPVAFKKAMDLYNLISDYIMEYNDQAGSDWRDDGTLEVDGISFQDAEAIKKRLLFLIVWVWQP